MTDTKPLAVVTGAEDKGLRAERLRATGADVQLVQTDLSTYEGVEQRYAAIVSTGRPVSAAALNAGVGQGGAFIDTDLVDEIKIIDLNITSTVQKIRDYEEGIRHGRARRGHPAGEDRKSQGWIVSRRCSR